MKKERLIDLVCFLLIILFVYAASSKLMEREIFEFVLSETPAIKKFASWISWLLPVTELAVAVLLLIDATRLAGLWSALILMLLMTAYLGWMIAFHRDLPCNCGGVLKDLSWKQHIVFNLFFVGLAGLGVVLSARKFYSRTNLRF